MFFQKIYDLYIKASLNLGSFTLTNQKQFFVLY